MINFVNGPAVKTLHYHGELSAHAGMLRTPQSGNSIQHAVDLNMPWALDNGCYVSYDPPAILRMLARWRGLPGCKFAVVPDVVGDHESTMLLFRAWVGTYHALGYPPAFVLQNGVKIDAIPWGSISAIFIGGDTAFKFSDVVRKIVIEGKRRGKWIHMGRVNSRLRIRYARSIGCDSFDGTGCSIAPRQRITELLPAYTGNRQMNLWEML